MDETMEGALSDDEFRQFVRLFRRYCLHDLDQFHQLKFTDNDGYPWFVHISRAAVGDAEFYVSWDSHAEPDGSPTDG